ncbi:MAG: glycerol-3-phosphate dehydrogenase [Gemmataceae bacterium]
MLPFRRVAILGDGGMGTALAVLLARRVEQVWLWSRSREYHDTLVARRENVRYLPGVQIPDEVRLTCETEPITETDLWVVAIPTVYLRQTLAQLRPLASCPTPAVSVAKGLEIATFARPSQIICEELGPRPVAVFSGPSHAEELSRGLPTSMVVAASDQDQARAVQTLFMSDRLRVYTQTDTIGVELAAALKNVIAIAAGISDGLGFGDNAKAALLTRAIPELIRFGTAFGACRETFFGLAGIGDLITTCISRHGRNRRVGELIGRGMPLVSVLGGMQQVAEGVYTVRSVYEKAQRLGLDLPIATEVYRVLYQGKAPQEAVLDLMMRQPKGE